MNRRNFLKRAAAVAAGAVALPTILKKSSPEILLKPWQLWPIQCDTYRWVQVYGLYCPGEINAAPVAYLNKVSHTPRYELGAMALTGDGRHYRYMKNCTTEQLIAEALC